jgi:hypothetical protein
MKALGWAFVSGSSRAVCRSTGLWCHELCVCAGAGGRPPCSVASLSLCPERSRFHLHTMHREAPFTKTLFTSILALEEEVSLSPGVTLTFPLLPTDDSSVLSESSASETSVDTHSWAPDSSLTRL